jgi:phage shock protein C
MVKRLYRSRTDALISGVCGGLGEYFHVDSNLVRILFIAVSVLTGFGILAYFGLWLLVPERGTVDRDLSDRIRSAGDQMADRARSIGESFRENRRDEPRLAPSFIGIALIVLGLAFFFRNLGFAWMRWFAIGYLWPIIPIVLGLAFLWRWWRGGE